MRRRTSSGARLVALGVAVGAALAGMLEAGPVEEPRHFAKATFAGGCFWCMEPPFEKLAGVLSVTAGYTGGSKPAPSYEEVSAGDTGHYEAVEVIFDPRSVSYEKLLETFWANVDPTDAGGQFCDRGTQYRAAIFVHDEDQKRLAEAARSAFAAARGLTSPLVVEVHPAVAFWRAEEYHQDYAKKNPERYRIYRTSCRRDARLEQLRAVPRH